MSELHFPDLSVKGFRGIKDLSVPRLGRVTLITGENNTGKSSVLEAIRLHSNSAAPHVIYEILAFREEYMRWAEPEERSFDLENEFPVSALFHGFPEIQGDIDPIVISTSGRLGVVELKMSVDWVSEERHPDGRLSWAPRQSPLFGESEGIAVLRVETEEQNKVFHLESFLRRPGLGRRAHSLTTSDESRMPCVFVSPYGGERTGHLGPLWDGIALTDNEQNVVEALRIIEPRISAVSMVGGETPIRSRKAIVRSDNIPRPVPLRSFGDGINRLFGIVLSLVSAGGGILLVDEFENGLHYSVQLDAWRMMFRLAQSLNVQIFATTHSQDAIEAFQKASAESPEDGALLKLTRRGDRIYPTVFVEDELKVATRYEIEVR